MELFRARRGWDRGGSQPIVELEIIPTIETLRGNPQLDVLSWESVQRTLGRAEEEPQGDATRRNDS